MRCAQAERWMDAALDEAAGFGALGGLSRSRVAELESHLTACPTCQQQWEALQTAEAVLRVPKPAAAPDGLLADFRARLDAEAAASRPAPPVKWRFAAWLWPVGSLAAAGAAAAVVMVLGVQVPTPTLVTPLEERTGTAASSISRPRIAASPSPSRDLAGNAAPTNSSHPSGNTDRHSAVASGAAIESKVTPAAPTSQDRSPADALTALKRQPTEVARMYDVPDQGTMAANGEQSKWNAPLAGTSPAGEAQGLQQLSKNSQFGAIVMPERLSTAQSGGSETRGLGLNRSRPADNTLRYTTPTLMAAETDYVQVSAAPLPPELNVSAAVLTALQRDVDLDCSDTSVRVVAQRLAEAADVVLKVDAKVEFTNITVQENGVPLWRVLEDVARQGGLQIVPRENTLVLSRVTGKKAVALAESRIGKPLDPPTEQRSRKTSPKSKALSPLARSIKPKTSPSAPMPTPAPPNVLFAQKEAQPDRLVWPEAWGNLPERGFAVPTASELPPLMLSREAPGPGYEVPQIRERATPSGNAAPAPAGPK